MAIVRQQEYTFAEFGAEMDISDQQVATLPVASDRQEAFKDIIYANVQQNFDTASTASGEAWAPHAPATVARHGPHPLLILSGAMKQAATESGAAGNYEEVDDRTLVVGLDMSHVNGFDYASAQQFGTSTIPSREFFALSDWAIESISRVAADYFIHEVIG